LTQFPSQPEDLSTEDREPASVFVTPLRFGPGGYFAMLVTDGSMEGLIRFGTQVGMSERQLKKGHVTLTPGQRLKALEKGAVEISLEDALNHASRLHGQVMEQLRAEHAAKEPIDGDAPQMNEGPDRKFKSLDRSQLLRSAVVSAVALGSLRGKR
jgi:hypothetical protein